jgi:serine/threonine-protein kinase
MRRGALLGIAFLASCPSTSARAQDTDADAFIRKGLELRRLRHDAEALEAFRRAYALKATPRALAQIALAEQALGDWVDAEADLDAALQSSGDVWIAPHRSALLEGLATIRSHLGWVEITADAPGTRAWVNGAPVGALPLPRPVRVEAGSVVIELRADGFVPVRRVAFVEPGGSAREAVRLVPLAPEPAPPRAEGRAALSPVTSTPAADLAPHAEIPSPSARDPRARAAAYVALGAGVVGLALGTYFGVRTLTTKQERDASCGDQYCVHPAGVALDAEARSLASRSTAWFVGGAVATAAGVALLWISRERLAGHAGATVRLASQFGADRASLSLELGGSW